MSERLLFALQRITAIILAVLVCVHIGTIIYASSGGLTASEILARTRANVPLAVIYAVFVAAAAVHAPIGLRNVLHEWTRLPRRLVDVAMALFALVLIVLGGRAVYAVFAP